VLRSEHQQQQQQQSPSNNSINTGNSVSFSKTLVTEKTIPSVDEEYKSMHYYSHEEMEQFRQEEEEERRRGRRQRGQEDDGGAIATILIDALTCVSDMSCDSLSYYSGALSDVPLMSVFNLDDDDDDEHFLE